MSSAVSVASELVGSVVTWECEVGDAVGAGQMLGLIESMKLHHEVRSPIDGTVTKFHAGPGEAVSAGQPLVDIAPASGADRSTDHEGSPPTVTPKSTVAGEPVAGQSNHLRPDLAEVQERHRLGLDEARPHAVARRREQGRQTARENISALLQPDTFVEYGALTIASQRSRRSHDELIAKTPADGMIAGIGVVDGPRFGAPMKVAVTAYDYTVMAGTQGHRNHLKKDRLFEVASKLELPVVVFTEGGGGRPGDTDTGGATGLDSLAFGLLAELSGRVPLVAINAGYCFAGNAALLGVCDVVIATSDSNIGMAGPAMIAGGGLGQVAPTDIGPIDVQSRNGVVDIVADDEAAAIEITRQYLSYFSNGWHPADEAEQPNVFELRNAVPDDRMRAYRMADVLAGIFDVDSVLELRTEFGRGMMTALARLDGRPVGVIANNPGHLSGAIDSDGADKASRFMQLCDAHGLPIISVVDTPGMMVGPEVEETGLVRHCSRLFAHGANLTVPLVALVTRKAYGLGAQAMMGGSTKAPIATLAWPTGEFGPMGLEGAVELGYRVELEACATDREREALFDELVARLYDKGKALSIAEYFEIDDVIDPASTRSLLARILDDVPTRRGQRPHIDTW